MSRTGRTSPLHIVRSFVDAERVNSRTGKLTHNTFGRFEEIDGKRYYIIRLINTDIIRHCEDGFTDLRHGGFITRITADRLNVFSRFTVSAYIPRTAIRASEMAVNIPAQTSYAIIDGRNNEEIQRHTAGNEADLTSVEARNWVRIFNS